MSDELLSNYHWSERALASLGLAITPALVAEALEDYWVKYANGLAGHTKVHIRINDGNPPRTEGALVGFFGKYSGAKITNRGPSNGTGPACNADIILRDRESGKRLLSLEGAAISNGRTGWFAVACFDLLLKGKQDIEVFLFGAGPLAEAVILALHFGAASKIKRIAVLSRGGKSNIRLVQKLSEHVQFTLEAVQNRSLLSKAKYVITATNAGIPVFETQDLAFNAVTLSLGIDDMPPDYFDCLKAAGGMIVGDDLEAMEKRNVDPLCLYYSRKGKRLTVEGRADGVKSYADVLYDARLVECLEKWDGPGSFVPVGLASHDIAVAALVYERLLRLLRPVSPNNVQPSPVSPLVPNRIERLKASMEHRGIDSIVCFKPENSFYLTSFNPGIHSHQVIGILTKKPGMPILILDTLLKEKADLTPGHRVVYTTGETWQDTIKNVLAYGEGNIGIEEEITALQREGLEKILPKATFSYASDLIQKCRNIKDLDEIVNARTAAELCNAGMRAAELSLISVGTEFHAICAAWNATFDLWGRTYGDGNVTWFGSSEGDDSYGFKPQVLAGRRRFLQIDKPTTDPIRDEVVAIRIQARYNGMHAELERTIVIGDVSHVQREALYRIETIRGEIFDALKPGVRLNELYNVARDRLTELDYPNPSRIGHGIGLGAYHLFIDAHTIEELAPGMIVTIAPRVEMQDKSTSASISDTVVITEAGFEFLAAYTSVVPGARCGL